MPSVHDRIGYTPKQAERLKHRLQLQVAKIEDATTRLRQIVPDANPDNYAEHISLDLMLEEYRTVAHGLGSVVDRRTRGRH